MKFFFVMAQHSPAGRRSLEDPLSILIHQLRALGHFAIMDPENDAREWPLFSCEPGAYNVMVEGFTPDVTEHIAAVHAQGARFLCLATEEPTEKGFNHGTSKEMRLRQEYFPDAMKYFDGILHLVPGQRVTDWYSQFCPAAYAELGYAHGLVKPDCVANPEWAFGFYGSVSERRLALLKRLAKYVKIDRAVKVMGDFADGPTRDRVMQNCKVILQIRKFNEMGLVSSSRCATSLFFGRPVLAEPHDTALSKPWDEIVRFAPSEEAFFLEAKLMLGRWRNAHQEQLKRFAEKLTPQVCIGRPLAHILANQPKRAVAA